MSYVSWYPKRFVYNQHDEPDIGTLKNEGIEFSITARPIVTKDFTWTTSYNVAYNKNV